MEHVVMTFEEWLSTHRKRASRLGDLARDVLVDANWPTGAGIEAYRFYIQRCTAWEAPLKALTDAWKAYRAYVRRNP
jgi:hypothetical protein